MTLGPLRETLTKNFDVSATNMMESHYVVVVVVALLFYVHGKHLRSCRDGQLT